MGQVLHGSATTTHTVREVIQRSKASIRELSERYGINPKTVREWRKRGFVEEAPMGLRERRSTVLSAEEEALIVAFRKHTLLPLDHCLYGLQATIPYLTRSSLHRLFQRHDISRLTSVEGDKSKKRFKTYRIGYVHIDIAEVRTEDGNLYMFVAIDRVSKFAIAELEQKANRRTASAFLEALIEAVPCEIHTVLTDNGVQFIFQRRHRDGPTAWYVAHMFDMRCQRHGIEHRLTKPNHLWINGQVEHMNRTIKEATVRRYYFDSHDRLRAHLADFLDAYNFAKRLRILKGLTPYEHICRLWTEQPERFRIDSVHPLPGLDTIGRTA